VAFGLNDVQVPSVRYTVDRVCVERVFSMPLAFESFRVRLEASVPSGQSTGDVVRALDREIVDIRNGTDRNGVGQNSI
jgi:hypothetical protein